jgi:hypothetical protein
VEVQLKLDVPFLDTTTLLLEFMMTSHQTLVKQISCQWNHTGKLIACPCVAVYDGNLNLPQLFSYSLSFDQQLFFEPPSTKITYFKLGN